MCWKAFMCHDILCMHLQPLWKLQIPIIATFVYIVTVACWVVMYTLGEYHGWHWWLCYECNMSSTLCKYTILTNNIKTSVREMEEQFFNSHFFFALTDKCLQQTTASTTVPYILFSSPLILGTTTASDRLLKETASRSRKKTVLSNSTVYIRHVWVVLKVIEWYRVFFNYLSCTGKKVHSCGSWCQHQWTYESKLAATKSHVTDKNFPVCKPHTRFEVVDQPLE